MSCKSRHSLVPLLGLTPPSRKDASRTYGDSAYLLEHLSEIISEKRAANESSGSTPVPGCSVRRPRRAQASVGSKADGGGSTIILAEITVAKVTSLVAKDLSGVEAGQSHPGRVCSPDPGANGLG